jgi:hypothetical protein
MDYAFVPSAPPVLENAGEAINHVFPAHLAGAELSASVVTMNRKRLQVIGLMHDVDADQVSASEVAAQTLHQHALEHAFLPGELVI